MSGRTEGWAIAVVVASSLAGQLAAQGSAPVGDRDRAVFRASLTATVLMRVRRRTPPGPRAAWFPSNGARSPARVRTRCRCPPAVPICGSRSVPIRGVPVAGLRAPMPITIESRGRRTARRRCAGPTASSPPQRMARGWRSRLPCRSRSGEAGGGGPPGGARGAGAPRAEPGVDGDAPRPAIPEPVPGGLAAESADGGPHRALYRAWRPVLSGGSVRTREGGGGRPRDLASEFLRVWSDHRIVHHH